MNIFKVQQLDTVEGLLDEDWTMEIVVWWGWTLVIVFEVGQSNGICGHKMLSLGMMMCMLMDWARQFD
jgi:hypothetical protein